MDIVLGDKFLSNRYAIYKDSEAVDKGSGPAISKVLQNCEQSVHTFLYMTADWGG